MFVMQPEHIAKGYCPRSPGERLPASYINHYVANGGVVVPAFGGFSADRDAEAVTALQKAYGPDRKVVSVPSREVLLNAGNVHCITQQNPSPRGGGSSSPKSEAPPPTPRMAAPKQGGSRFRVFASGTSLAARTPANKGMPSNVHENMHNNADATCEHIMQQQTTPCMASCFTT